MSETTYRSSVRHEGLITALSVGGFLIILGSIFGLTPEIIPKIISFFGDLTGVTYPLNGGQLMLPVPANPAQHLDVFGVIFNFMVSISVLQVIILVMRFWTKSPTNKIAETIGNTVFWLGGAFVANICLLTGTIDGWFQFWGSLIIIIGVSLIAQFIVYSVKRSLCHV